VGFSVFVNTAAAKSPRQSVTLSNNMTVEAKAADIQPLNVEQSFTKPALIRIIQILKRHRDEFFKNNHDKAPISVIITTLATHSYDRAVSQNTYDSVYDLMLDVVGGMLDFIKVNPRTAEVWIANPSHPAENFAEKWNSDPSLAESFYLWQRIAIAAIKALAEEQSEGLDKVGIALENSFGPNAANHAIRSLSASLREKTAAKRIAVTSAGLVTPVAFGIRTASKNLPHTNHGG
jgi:hypothetical protein